MKAMIIIVTLCTTFISYSQVPSENILRVFNQPVKYGYIKLPKDQPIHYFYEPIEELSIFSNIDSVFSIGDGKVTMISKVDSATIIVIRSAKGRFFAYRNLTESKFKNGDLVKEGEFIGLLKRIGPDPYELKFRISTEDGDLSYTELLEFFKARIEPKT